MPDNANLPGALPDDTGPPAGRNPDGTFRAGPAASAWAAKGGRAKAEARRLRGLLGFAGDELGEDDPARAYVQLARWWCDAEAFDLADEYGASGPAVAAELSAAALCLAASRFLYDRAIRGGRTRDFAEAGRMAERASAAHARARQLARDAYAAGLGGHQQGTGGACA